MSETDDLFAISRLQAAYGDVVTRRAWAELADLFMPDAAITIDTRTGRPPTEVIGPEALGVFIEGAIERFEFFEFALLNAVAELDKDGASGRYYLWELRQERVSGRFTSAFGVYEDRYVKAGPRWLFGRRDYFSLARTHPDPAAPGDLEVFPFPL